MVMIYVLHHPCMRYIVVLKTLNRPAFTTTVYPKKYARGFCFAVLCCGYTLTDFPISIRLTSLALWQSNDCPSASEATLMNMDKYFMWIHYEQLHNHNKAKHNKTVCIFLGYTVFYYPPLPMQTYKRRLNHTNPDKRGSNIFWRSSWSVLYGIISTDVG